MWGGRTVGAMDGAIEPPWIGLRRVLPAHAAQPFIGVQLLLSGCRPAAGTTAGAGRSPAQAPKRSSSIAISGAAPAWIAAAWLSVRGSTRAK